MNTLFITGIGTGIGKTFFASLLMNALKADYWKPIQAGLENKDADFIVRHNFYNGIIYPETYLLKEACSAHEAARKENIKIQLEKIKTDFQKIRTQMPTDKTLIVEGVGGLLSPINEEAHNIDLIKCLNLPILLVSKNYLGSINHSLLCSEVLKKHQLKILAWGFNAYNENYENDIMKWSDVHEKFSIPKMENYPAIGDDIFEVMKKKFANF